MTADEELALLARISPPVAAALAMLDARRASTPDQWAVGGGRGAPDRGGTGARR